MLCMTGVYLRDITNMIFVILHWNVSRLSVCFLMIIPKLSKYPLVTKGFFINLLQLEPSLIIRSQSDQWLIIHWQLDQRLLIPVMSFSDNPSPRKKKNAALAIDGKAWVSMLTCHGSCLEFGMLILNFSVWCSRHCQVSW